jgi:hypothetical protein
MKVKQGKKTKVQPGWHKELPKEQLARWMALYEAVNIVADKALERDIKLQKIKWHIPELKRYVDTTSDTISRLI